MFFLFVSERAKMKNRTCTATVLDNKTFATLKDIKWTGINQKKSTRQNNFPLPICMQTSFISVLSMNTKFCESCFASTGCWPSTWVSLASGVSSAPEGWSTSTTVFISPGRRVRVRTLPSGQDTSSTVTSSLPENRRDSKTNQPKKNKINSASLWAQKPRLSLLTPAVTQAEVCDRLHLAQVPGASVDDAGVNSTPPGEGRDCGSPCERAKLGARDDPQPVVGRALVGIHTLLFTSNIRCKHDKCAKSSFPSSDAYLASFWKATLVGQSVRWAVIGAWVQHVSQHPAIKW